MREQDFDVIHTTTYAGAIPASLVSRWSGVPVILTVHEVFGSLWRLYKPGRAWVYRWFESMIFWFGYDRYHCVSRYTFNSLRLLYGIPDQRMSVIHNGVAPERSLSTISKKSIDLVSKKYRLKKYSTVLYYGHAGASK